MIGRRQFRFNNRGTRKNPVNGGERFSMPLLMVTGKRLTYKELTGKTLDAGSDSH